MQLDKDMILNFLREHGKQQEAQQAQDELPQQVDTDQHAGLLSKYGIDVQQLIEKFAGDKLGGQLGGQLGKFL